MVELAQVKSGGRAPIPSNYGKLTSREAEVLQLIAEEYANKQIAAGAEHQHQDRREAPSASDGEARSPRHRRCDSRYAISAGVVAASA